MSRVMLWTVVIVGGAVIGTVLGEMVGRLIPSEEWRQLFLQPIVAGLHPIRLDLKLVELQFGLLFKLNAMSLVGIAAAAALFRWLTK